MATLPSRITTRNHYLHWSQKPHMLPKSPELNQWQVRWSLLLSEFNIKLIHLSGSKLFLADTLSRRPDMIPDEDHDNKDIVLLPDNLFINLIDTELQQWEVRCESDQRNNKHTHKWSEAQWPSDAIHTKLVSKTLINPDCDCGYAICLNLDDARA